MVCMRAQYFQERSNMDDKGVHIICRVAIERDSDTNLVESKVMIPNCKTLPFEVDYIIIRIATVGIC